MKAADHPIFSRNGELREFLHLIRYEVQQAQRPANEIILDDEAVMRILGISKRTLQYMKVNRVIPSHRFDKSSPRTYYLLSDLLTILKENRTEAISKDLKIK